MGVGRVIYDTLADFGRHTTIGGLCNAGLASSRVRQAYWLIIFAVLFALTMDSIVKNIQQFLKYEVTTSTDLSYSNSLMFPAITICNQNRVHCVNLFQQIYNLKTITDGISSTNSTDYNQYNKRFKQLRSIFDLSGCQTQVCTTLFEGIPAFSNTSDITPLISVLKIATANCSIYSNKSPACYAILAFNATVNASTSPSTSDLSNAWSTIGCTMDVACNYAYAKPSAGCSPSGQGGGGAGGGGVQNQVGRKKRQVTGQGPQSARSPPPVAPDFQTEANFLKNYMQLTDLDRILIGHQLASFNSTTFGSVDGFLHACTYKGRDCSDSSIWYTFSTPKFGNCFSFNSYDNLNDSDVPRQASLTGRDYGIKVELFLDQDNYMLQKLSKNAGSKLVIHDPSLPPLPDEYGIDMQPNTASSIALQTTNISRYTAPYTPECISTWSETGLNIQTNVNYSLDACQRFILQSNISNDCNCFHPNLVQTKINTTFGKLPCNITPNLTIGSDFFCFGGVIDMFNNGTRNTDVCHVVCNEYQFTFSLSTSTWPSDQYWLQMAAGIPKYSNELASGTLESVVEADLQSNFAQAEVFFQTLNVVSISQSPTLDGNALVSALGGSLGLFTGIAIIMIFEILELTFDIFYNIWKNSNQPKEKGKSSKVAEYPIKMN